MANRFLNNIRINDSYTFPSADGDADQIIQTDGAGNLSFIDTSTISVGESEQVHIACKNTSGVAISKGDPVYITGTVGTSFRVEIAKADASNSDKMPAVGLAESDLAINAEGYVVVSGVLKNITTDPLSTGDGTPSPNDTVYVKAGGGLTRTKPTGSGNLIQNVGKVGRVQGTSAGSIAVSTIMRTNDVPNLTTGKIWVGSPTYTTESTVVHLDESNGRMGIGTTNPGYKLDVDGGAGVALRLNSTADYQLKLTSSNSWTGIEFDDGAASAADHIWHNGQNQTFAFGGGGSNVSGKKLHVHGATTIGSGLASTAAPTNGLLVEGNVGISDTNSGKKLSVKVGSSNDDGIVIKDENDNIRTDLTLAGTAGAREGRIKLIDNSGNTNVQIHSDAVSYFNGGNVGIGTTSPATNLEVISDTGAVLRLGTSDTVVLDGDTIGRIEFFSSDSTNTNSGIGAFIDLVADGDQNNFAPLGDLRFATSYASAQNATTRMTIKGDGKIGIGTTSPTHLLTLETASSPSIKIKDTTQGATLLAFSQDSDSHLGTYSAHPLVLDTNSTERMRIDSNGNVGIGITNPNYKLHLEGIVGFKRINVEATSTIDMQGNFNFDAESGYSHVFKQAGAEKVRILPNGNVGIGTPSPDVKLDIEGTGGELLRLRDTDGTYTALTLYNDAANTNSRNWGIYNNGYNWGDFNIVSSTTNTGAPDIVNATRLTIRKDGYVGIGTANPNEILHAAGNIHAYAAGGIDASLYASTSGGSTTIAVRSNGITHFNGGNVGIGTPSPSAKLHVQGTSFFFDQAIFDDKIGVGTTSPSQKLHVSGNARVTGAYYDSNNSPGTSGQVLSSTATGTDWVSLSEIQGVDGTGTANYVAKWSDTDTITDSIIYDDGGIVTIGSTQQGWSGNQLNVGSTSNGASGINILTSTTGSAFIIFSDVVDGTATEYANQIKFSHTDNFLAIETEGTERLRIKSGGNVGIGTTDPREKLDVGGNIVTTWGNDRFIGLQFQTGGDYRNGLLLHGDNRSTGILAKAGSGSDPYIWFGGGVGTTSEWVRINKDGNVGIGTISPEAILHVEGSNGYGAIQIGRDTGANEYQYINFGGNTAGDAAWQIGKKNNSSDVVGPAKGFYVYDLAASVSRLVIDTSGNVGIGTPSPSYKFQVNGDTAFYSAAGSLNGIITQGLEGRGRLYLYDAGNPTIALQTNGVSYFNNGNVGIGTTSPTSDLHVVSSGTAITADTGTGLVVQRNQDTYNGAIIAIIGGTGGNSNLDFGDSDDQNIGRIIYSHTDDSMRFITNTSEKVCITSAGNVGIGTTLIDEKLHVQGNIKFEQASGNIDVRYTSNGTNKYNMFYQASTDGWGLYYNPDSAYRLFVSGSGDVGIGTNNPGAKLEVAGTLKATGEVTLSNYSDGGLSVNSSGVVRVEPSYQNISLGESYAANLREYYYRNGYTVSPTDTGYQYAKLIDQGLLNKASLVLIPQAQKEGLLAANKPNGTDFTFSRASAATRVNSEGLIEKERGNLLLQSNTFDTTWGNDDSTETSGQSGYDGSSDAWLLERTNANGRTGQVISLSGVLTYSIYLKAGTKSWARLATSDDNFNAFFDLSNGIIGTKGSSTIAKIETVGNGWYRCSITANSTIIYVNLWIADSDNDTSGTSGNIYMQDAQLEKGLVATDYIETTTTTAVSGITEDLPRLDYSGGASCPSLLLEPQRTNLMPHSDYIAGWLGANTTAIANTGISPEGVSNATSITFASGGYWYEAINVSYTAGQTFVWSIYANTSTQVILWGGATPSGTSTYEIIDAGNGWYRQILTITTSGSGTGQFQPLMAPVYIGVGVEFKVFGAQFEANASYVSSYIPSYGSAVTRGGDSCYKTGISDLIGQTEGTLYAEVDLNHISAANNYILQVSYNSENRIFLYKEGGTNKIGCYALIGSTTIYNKLTSGAFDGVNKIAFAYKSGDFAFYVNGTQIGTSTATFSASTTFDRIDIDANAGIENGYFSYNQALLFKTRLSNAELAALTTI